MQPGTSSVMQPKQYVGLSTPYFNSENKPALDTSRFDTGNSTSRAEGSKLHTCWLEQMKQCRPKMITAPNSHLDNVDHFAAPQCSNTNAVSTLKTLDELVVNGQKMSQSGAQGLNVSQYGLHESTFSHGHPHQSTVSRGSLLGLNGSRGASHRPNVSQGAPYGSYTSYGAPQASNSFYGNTRGTSDFHYARLYGSNVYQGASQGPNVFHWASHSNISQDALHGPNVSKSAMRSQNVPQGALPGAMHGQSVSQAALHGHYVSHCALQNQTFPQPALHGQNVSQGVLERLNVLHGALHRHNMSQGVLQKQNISQIGEHGQSVYHSVLYGQNVSSGSPHLHRPTFRPTSPQTSIVFQRPDVSQSITHKMTASGSAQKSREQKKGRRGVTSAFPSQQPWPPLNSPIIKTIRRESETADSNSQPSPVPKRPLEKKQALETALNLKRKLTPPPNFLGLAGKPKRRRMLKRVPLPECDFEHLQTNQPPKTIRLEPETPPFSLYNTSDLDPASIKHDKDSFVGHQIINISEPTHSMTMKLPIIPPTQKLDFSIFNLVPETVDHLLSLGALLSPEATDSPGTSDTRIMVFSKNDITPPKRGGDVLNTVYCDIGRDIGVSTACDGGPMEGTQEMQPDLSAINTSDLTPQLCTEKSGNIEPSTSTETDTSSRDPANTHSDTPSHAQANTHPDTPSHAQANTHQNMPSHAQASSYPDTPTRDPASSYPDTSSRDPASSHPDTPSRDPASSHPDTPSRDPAISYPDTPSRDPASSHPDMPSRDLASPQPDTHSRDPASYHPDTPSRDPPISDRSHEELVNCILVDSQNESDPCDRDTYNTESRSGLTIHLNNETNMEDTNTELHFLIDDCSIWQTNSLTGTKSDSKNDVINVYGNNYLAPPTPPVTPEVAQPSKDTHAGCDSLLCSSAECISTEEQSLLTEDKDTHLVIPNDELVSSQVQWFACNVCSYKIEKLFNFRLHMAQHSADSETLIPVDTAHYKLRCGICGYFGTDEQDLSHHVEDHAFQKRFLCGHCDLDFQKKSEVRQHISKAHKNTILFYDRQVLYTHMARQPHKMIRMEASVILDSSEVDKYLNKR